jgi:hypothetical protein
MLDLAVAIFGTPSVAVFINTSTGGNISFSPAINFDAVAVQVTLSWATWIKMANSTLPYHPTVIHLFRFTKQLYSGYDKLCPGKSFSRTGKTNQHCHREI